MKNQIEFSEVYLMDAQGRHPRRLTTVTKGKPYSGDVGRASWSPDGRQVVVAHVTPASESGIHDLYIVSVPSGRVRRLTPNSVRAEDPTGRRTARRSSSAPLRLARTRPAASSTRSTPTAPA